MTFFFQDQLKEYQVLPRGGLLAKPRPPRMSCICDFSLRTKNRKDFNSPQREKVNNLIEGKASSLRDEFSTEIAFCFLTRQEDECTAVGIEMSHSDGRMQPK